MIRIKQVATTKVEVYWDTGNDLRFLTALKRLITLRNEDQTKIKKLERKK